MTSTPEQPSSPANSQTLTLSDGRALGYASFGSPPSSTVPTVLYFHGFPGSRLEAGIIANLSLPVPFHVLAIDRPGMGLSTFQPNRRILDWPADVLALVDHLHIEKFHVVGDSGGSPYALVCAKEIPRTRVLSASVISGIYPLSLGTKGMSLGLKALLYAGLWLPQSLMAMVMDWEMGNIAKNPNKEEFEKSFMKMMASRPEIDRKCLDDLPFREIVIASTREAFKQGSRGLAYDFKLYGDWGFKLDDISGENVTIWHGKKDVNTPFDMAEKASKLIIGCEFKAFDEESHLSLPYHKLEDVVKSILKL
ncbi:alpha/beta-hydrolase [Stipitochalara longipes BDJ]|nr:alpha/beta-hydrolase [Stipitochalara longipes BDJ]